MAGEDDKTAVEPEVKPEAKPPASVPEVKPQAEAKPEQKPEAKPQVEPEAKPTPTPDWRDARIAKLTGQLREIQEKLAAQPKPPAAEPEGEARLTQADVEARARELAATERFNQDCAAAAARGREAYADFDSRVREIGQKLVTANDPASVAAHMALVQAALQTGKAHEVLYKLGGDLGEAQRLLSLPPLAMAVEVAKLGMQPAEEPSKLPKPIAPIGAKGTVEEIRPDDPERGAQLTTAEWMRRREAQVQKGREVRGR